MSVITLPGYARRYIEDRARFKVARFARQTGKSFSSALEMALDMAEVPHTPWVSLSSGQRAVKEKIDKVAMHLRAYEQSAEVFDSEWAGEAGRYLAHEIKLRNGSRIIGLPANPDTARGHSANVDLDEFAFHRDSRKIWTALFPTITRGYKLRVQSTPQGKQNKFYELATNDKYSQHVVTIVDAVHDGLELRDPESGELITPDELRIALGDDEAFEQEYMVVFLDEATAFLSYELLAAAEDLELSASPPWIVDLVDLARDAHRQAPATIEPLSLPLPIPPGRLRLGGDIARRRDLLVYWLTAQRGDVDETWAVLELRGEAFGVAERVLYTLMERLPIERACIDQTGMGMQLAERALERFGSHRVEPVTFTNAAKEALAVGMKKRIEDRRFTMPAEREYRESFHSIKKLTTSTGNFRFDADRTEATGHADHFWAAALAVQAGSQPAAPMEFQSAGQRRPSGSLSRWTGQGAEKRGDRW